MAFSFTWDVTVPADAEDINLGASRIRDGKSAIQERVAVDHSFANDANDGLHLHSEYIPQSPAPTPVNNTDGVVFVAVVSGVAELFYKDTAGHTLQLTTNGKLQLVAASATGGLTVAGGVNVTSGGLAVVGDTAITGNTTLEQVAATDLFVIYNSDGGASAKAAWTEFQSFGVARWVAGKNTEAESGGNAGSNYDIVGANDAGATLGVWFRIVRATGVILTPGMPTSAPAASRALWDNAGVVNITP